VKKLLFGLIAVAMVVAMIGSAFAYFTDVETSTGNVFQAGTLNMNIADNNEAFNDTGVSVSYTSPAGLVPGQTFVTDPVSLKNVGSINIRYVFGRIGNLVQTEAGFANKFKLVAYLEKAANSTGATVVGSGPDLDGFYSENFDEANANSYLSYWGMPQVGYITLADLVAATPLGSSVKTGLWFFDGGNDPTNPPLAVGGTAQIKFKFELLADTTNEYQGDSVSFTIDFVGAQTDTALDASITEY